MTFAVGTFTEGFVTLFGWNAFIFRSWYIAGALLDGAPMAQGTVYLLLRRRTANILTAGLVPTIMVAALCVLASLLDLTQAEPFRGPVRCQPEYCIGHPPLEVRVVHELLEQFRVVLHDARHDGEYGLCRLLMIRCLVLSPVVTVFTSST